MTWRPRFFLLALTVFCPGVLAAEMLFKGSLVAGGKPVPGAALRLLAAPDRAQDLESYFSDLGPKEIGRTRSDRDGYFELAAPGEGFYRLVVEGEGYLGAFYPLAMLGPGNVSLHPISLIPARRARLGVFGPQGEKIAAARVRMIFERDGGPYPVWPQLVSTGEDGGLGLLLPAETEAKVLISAAGFPLHEQQLEKGKAAFEARLVTGASVEIEIADARRRPLPGVAIFSPESAMALGRSGSDGRATVHLAAGQLQLLFMDGEGRHTTAAPPPAAPERAAAPWRVQLDDPPLLTGRVVELSGGLPLAEAWVYVPGRFPRFTRSDRAGYFELVAPRTQSGAIRLAAVKDGYMPATVEVSALSPALTVGLAPGARVDGRVVDAAGRGVAGAQVFAAFMPGSPSARSRAPSNSQTDRDGRFVLYPLVTGEELELGAVLGRIQIPATTLAKLEPGERRSVELVLPRLESWTCRVVDKNGKPVPGATLQALKVRRPGHAELPDALFWLHLVGEGNDLGSSDVEGRIRVDSLAAGLYTLGVRAPGFAPAVRRSVRLGAAAGEPTPLDAAGELEIELRRAVTARGKVVDEKGRGIAGAGISYSLIDPENPGIFRVGRGAAPIASTDERGEFHFTEVEAGHRIDLLAHQEGYLEAALRDVPVDEGPLLLTLRRGGRVSGQILAEGAPRAAVRLHARPLPAERLEALPLDQSTSDHDVRPFIRAISDVHGRFLLDGFAPGRYRLEVDPPPGFQPWDSELAEVPGGSEQKLLIQLEKAVVVIGKVLLDTGEPVEAVSVSHGRGDPQEAEMRHRDTRTDQLGQFRIETASPGPGWLRVFSLEHGSRLQTVDLAAGINEIDVVLERGQLELAAKILSPDGEPIAGADVKVIGNELVRMAKSGIDGSIHFVALKPGQYRVTIDKDGFVFPLQPLELERSQEVVWRVEKAAEPAGD